MSLLDTDVRALATPGATPGRVPGESFSLTAFATLLRAVQRVPGSQTEDRSRAQLPTDGLEEAPDVAVAWVFGLYSAIFDRMPDRDGLAHHARWLREGGSPAGLADVLVHADEAVVRAAEVPARLEEAFVVGAYLAVLGRYPEAQGLTSYSDLIAQGAAPEAVLGELMGSVEAWTVLRFPPPPTDTRRLLAEGLQLVVLNAAPVAALTDHLAARLAAGSTPVHLVRWLLLRTRNPLQVTRGVGAGRLALAAQLHASSEAGRLDGLATRAWQWRVERQAIARRAGLEAKVDGVRAQLHDVTARLTAAQWGSAP